MQRGAGAGIRRSRHPQENGEKGKRGEALKDIPAAVVGHAIPEGELKAAFPDNLSGRM